MNHVRRFLMYAATVLFFAGTTHAEISAIVLTGQAAPDEVGYANFISFSQPSMNNSGEIAFHAGLTKGMSGIFRLSHGKISIVAMSGFRISKSTQLTYGTMGDPIINDSGQVAFVASVIGGQTPLQAVFVRTDTTTSMVFDTTAPVPGSSETISLMKSIQFNNRGDIAVGIDLTGTAGSGILFFSNGTMSSILGASGSFSLNNTGAIAYLGSDGGIHLFSGGATQLIVQSGQTVPNTSLSLDTLKTPVLNDRSDVVFINGFYSGLFMPMFFPNAVIQWHSGSLEKIVSTNDPFPGDPSVTLYGNFNSPSIDNSGRVVFAASISSGGGGIFSSNNGNLTMLVQDGQVLVRWKSTFVGAPDANDSGAVTFISNLEGTGAFAGIFQIDPTNELYFPRVADGTHEDQWSWRTTLILSNRNNSGPAAVSINFVQEDGTPMMLGIQNLTNSQFSFVVPLSGTLQLETTGIGNVKTGWARVQSDKELSGIAIFSLYDGEGKYISEVGAPATAGLNAFSVFAELRTDTNTAIVFTNPNPSAAQATLTLRDDQGNSLGSPINLTIPENGEIAKYLTELFQGIVSPDFHGTIDVVSQLPIIGLNLRQRKDVFTWLPLIQ
jgi:hypothetical protein